MKKILSLLLALAFGTMLQAQVEKGSWVALGCFSIFNNTQTIKVPNQTDQVSKNLQLEADVGPMYMINNMIGLMAAVTLVNNVNKIDGDKSSSEFLSGPRLGARFYMPCMAPRFYSFAMVYAAMAFGNSINYSGGQIASQYILTYMSVAIAAGLAYYLTPYLALEMQFGLMGWNNNVSKNKDNEAIKEVNNSLEFFLNAKAITIGLSYWFGRSGGTF